MELIVDPTGTVRCLYDEEIDPRALGQVFIRRASRVEPDNEGRWWADLSPIRGRGPDLGPFERRSQALAAERAWLAQHLMAH
jgi:hypothetical protein